MVPCLEAIQNRDCLHFLDLIIRIISLVWYTKLTKLPNFVSDGGESNCNIEKEWKGFKQLKSRPGA